MLPQRLLTPPQWRRNGCGIGTCSRVLALVASVVLAAALKTGCRGGGLGINSCGDPGQAMRTLAAATASRAAAAVATMAHVILKPWRPLQPSRSVASIDTAALAAALEVATATSLSVALAGAVALVAFAATSAVSSAPGSFLAARAVASEAVADVLRTSSLPLPWAKVGPN